MALAYQPFSLNPVVPGEAGPDLRPALWEACAALDGTRYVFGGRNRAGQGGLDCAGYVLECLHQVGIDLTGGQPYDSGKWLFNVERLAAQCTHPSTPLPGDLIIFEGTYDDANGVPVEYSHVGFIRDPRPVGTMYDCNSTHGAGLTDYKTPYWVEHYHSFCRVPGLCPEPGSFAESSWTAGEIAGATGCPEGAIAHTWPLVLAELVKRGGASRNSQAGAIATIAIETASRFRPIEELYNDPPGKDAYFEGMYGIGHHPSAAAMGHTRVGDGARYFGRGNIQLTWKNNYAYYGGALGYNLVDRPELALDDQVAAEIFALYWVDHGIPGAADQGDWATVRSKVQGGHAGLPRLRLIVSGLLG